MNLVFQPNEKLKIIEQLLNACKTVSRGGGGLLLTQSWCIDEH